MTITDEELYRLADKYPMSPRDVRLLREAVLQRFKPREPRVIERWGVVNKNDESRFVGCSSEKSARVAVGEDWYLAKAVITEVMDPDQ